MKTNFLDIPLNYLPKAGFHESHILKFKTTKERLIIRILTSPFYNDFIKDTNFLKFLTDLEKDALVLELEIEYPKYEFSKFNSFYDYLDSEIDFSEIIIDGKVVGYSLFILGYPDNMINVDNFKNDELINKYGLYPLDLKIFGFNLKWKIIGKVTNIDFNSKTFYLDELKKIYSKD